MTKLQQTLLTAFSTNFVLYYNTHVSHVNLKGEDFLQFHDFLGDIYEDLQENIDKYGEFLRICDVDMPASLNDVLLESEIVDNFNILGIDYSDYIGIFETIYNQIETLIEVLKDLYVMSEKNEDYGLSGYVQERLVKHKKDCWKLKMILTKEKEYD